MASLRGTASHHGTEICGVHAYGSRSSIRCKEFTSPWSYMFYPSFTEGLRLFNIEERGEGIVCQWTWEYCCLSLTASGVLRPSGWTFPLHCLLLGLPVPHVRFFSRVALGLPLRRTQTLATSNSGEGRRKELHSHVAMPQNNHRGRNRLVESLASSLRCGRRSCQ